MRTRTWSTLIAAALFTAMLSSATPIFAAPGTGGWYWPTGTEVFTMSGWWDFRGTNWHLAQDMGAAAGRPVYAVGAGTVLESKYVSGYGPGGTQGGAVVILHKTATGAEFKALYGHLYSLRYAKGATVPAGAVVGLVNGSSPNHLHFGIHPGRAYPPDNNPYRGHTYTSSTAYGWVNPVAYLRANPRLLSYSAPALPVVASVLTTRVADSVGARDGIVYWQHMVPDEAPERWRYRISTRQLSSQETTPPAFDKTRYLVSVTSVPRGVRVIDRRPVLTFKTADTTPRWRSTSRLYGTLRNAKGLPFVGATVSIERYSAGVWTRVAKAVTAKDGSYSVAYAPRMTSTLRARFVPPSSYASAVSSSLALRPHVALSAPTLSTTSPSLGRRFTVTSMLTPEHATTSSVRFIYEFRSSTGWVRMADKPAVLTDAGTTTRAAAAYVCGKRGAWRVRSWMPTDWAHAATFSASRYFTVR